MALWVKRLKREYRGGAGPHQRKRILCRVFGEAGTVIGISPIPHRARAGFAVCFVEHFFFFEYGVLGGKEILFAEFLIATTIVVFICVKEQEAGIPISPDLASYLTPEPGDWQLLFTPTPILGKLLN